MNMQPLRLFRLSFLIMVVICASEAAADSRKSNNASPDISGQTDFQEQAGAALYADSCQACHMDKGQGAAGAGRYPALADNPNLAESSYPVYIVLHGLDGMPPVGQMMSDAQVAAVINYVRTHFGNNYKDAVTARDVAAAR
ncbi:c-type cytochrome [Brucella sp. IR073]|uniref:c-type cytochrome n=1 Tax=unclassified Brucella TaxID=2632610 RepID=UPI003B987EF9